MRKKILFWIDSGSMNIFGLSKYLQSDTDAEFFTIYDVTDKPKKFFQEQKLVNFKKIWFYHDFIKEKTSQPDLNYLRKFEKDTNISIWKLASTERIFLYNEFYKFSTEEIKSILEQECKFFENVLNEVKPDFVIMVKPIFHHDMLFVRLCKSKGIQVLDLAPTRFTKFSVISFDEIRKKYDEFKMSANHRTFDELRKYRIEHASLKIGDYQSSKNNFLSSGIQYVFSQNENPSTHYTYFGRSKSKVVLNYIFDVFRTRSRKKFIDKNFCKEFKEDKKFILYSAMVDIESNVLLHAPFHINQIEVVKNIAKSMPSDHILLVKEHPGAYARSWRSVKSYKELRDIPGVKLIHPDADMNELIKKSSLVVSISSSASLDALFLEKPTILFAETDFSMIESIQRIKEIEKLPEIIKAQMEQKIDPSEIEKYIQFIEKNSFEYDMYSHEQEMQQLLYHGGMLVDVNNFEDRMNMYLEKTRSRFNQLKKPYLEKILASKMR